MEEGDNILEAILDEGEGDDDNLEDVDMLDVEEGEFVVDNESKLDLEQNIGGHVGRDNVGNMESQNKNHQRHRANKKRRRNKKNRGGTNVTDINQFVLDTCRCLKEKKSYMVYTAVGCLGVSALSDLVKEVDAIQSCGGQKTIDGGRFRTGGGILWNIMKTREPMAYKEIMKKAKEFEKQFRQRNIRPARDKNSEGISQSSVRHTDGTPTSVPYGSQDDLAPQYQHEQSDADEKRKSVHDRIRIPVSYDDLLGDDRTIDGA